LFTNLSRLPELRDKIGNHKGVINYPVAAMELHVQDESLQSQACQLLDTLARGSRTAKQTIIDADGRVAIDKALEHHRKSGERSIVDDECCRVLSFLSEP